MNLNDIQEESFSFIRFTFPKLDPGFNACLFIKLFSPEEAVKCFREDDGYFRYYIDVSTYKFDDGTYSYKGFKTIIIDTINKTFVAQQEIEKNEEEENRERIKEIKNHGLEYQFLLEEDFSDKLHIQEFISNIKSHIKLTDNLSDLPLKIKGYNEAQTLLNLLHYYREGDLKKSYEIWFYLESYLKDCVPDQIWEVILEFFQRNLAVELC